VECCVTRNLLWPELATSDIEEGWLDDPGTGYRTSDVLRALEARHWDASWNGSPARWVFVAEVQERTGVYGDAQRFDAVAVGLVPSVKYARVIYEIKVSRSDWLRELRPITEARYRGHRLSRAVRRWTEDDVAGLVASGYEIQTRSKWAAALELSTEFYFAAPPKCVLLSEVPPECGLIEVRPWGPERQMRARVVVKAPVRDTPHPGPEFWAAVLRRAAVLGLGAA
jgi:hypothetical protein